MIGLKVIGVMNQGNILGKKFTVKDVEIVNETVYYIVINNDSGEEVGWVKSSYFKPISEVREDILNELGI